VETRTVIGRPVRYRVKGTETLYDIARAYGLGINEITDKYPHIDLWIPPEGIMLSLPTCWVLPQTQYRGIVINLAELRLYYFRNNGSTVMTFPVGVGAEDWETPLGTFQITAKAVNPTWSIPHSLRSKYDATAIPPGPDNPLGKYWLGLGDSGYGIHGTNVPWSVGHLMTHGCIRLYPEHIEILFPLVGIGTAVEIIYQPVKIGRFGEKIFVEVHRDIYHTIEDFRAYGIGLLQKRGILDQVDIPAFQRALELREGMPVDVTR
jgi:L,D-transpeptidase ErfK/SrfK